MKHQWILNKDGEIDNFIHNTGFHNGPECSLCGYSRCEHCHNVYEDESCDGGIAERKRIAINIAELDKKILALSWALLPPEAWDSYPVELAEQHRKTLSKMCVELEIMRKNL